MSEPKTVHDIVRPQPKQSAFYDTARIASDAISVESNGDLVFDVVLAREMVQSYGDRKEFKPASELREAVRTARRAHVTFDHPKTTIVQHNADIIGEVLSAEFIEDIKGIKGRAKVYAGNKKVIEDVRSGVTRDVSIGFHYTADMTSGDHDGMRYDIRQTDIVIDHLAIVPSGFEGRCSSKDGCGISPASDHKSNSKSDCSCRHNKEDKNMTADNATDQAAQNVETKNDKTPSAKPEAATAQPKGDIAPSSSKGEVENKAGLDTAGVKNESLTKEERVMIKKATDYVAISEASERSALTKTLVECDNAYTAEDLSGKSIEELRIMADVANRVNPQGMPALGRKNVNAMPASDKARTQLDAMYNSRLNVYERHVRAFVKNPRLYNDTKGRCVQWGE